MFLASISYSLFNGWTGRSLKRGDGIESKNGRGPVNRERGNEHGRERERECGRDWGHGRERERECGRDRGHGRDKERERGCDNDRERDSRRERDQERERGYDQAGSEMDHGYSHGKEAGYGSESKHGRKGRAQGEEILSMCASYDKAQSDYYQSQYGYADHEPNEKDEAVERDYGYYLPQRSLSREHES
ncbi:hypothetical protein B296_00037605 [Ensete ventricosum]|uniref:Uncharacterized protein n=1 Tax=Ensete ventricosum TaxID=4639 RepID=A0A426ZZ29_ENSVE|nr:hypothetical protein B296_00037605 [Ensete ventricosum]